MRTRIMLAAIAAATSMLSVTASAETMEGQVKAAYEAWDAAFNQGDAKTVASLYTDDAMLLPPTHDVIEGTAGIEQFFTGVIGSGATDHTLQPIRIVEDDDTVVAAARWSAKGKDRDGVATTFQGMATHVFERQDDGSLKLGLHTFN